MPCTYNDGLGCGEGYCYLIDEWKEQMKHGGIPKPGENRGNGPFWSIIQFEKYARRSKQAAEEGCVCAQELRRLIDKSRDEKKSDGTIYE